ncbi:hypothetical protein [Streptomyces spongiae]|uniref:Uncharacterized protein n=1 Tax=Streptomyces spongiae TaxID=565072 RepID=A0A5N8XKR2_9ACTN|nr:hypothetical protein [Streptomyces spongiae]MPY60053.1 hypothetical protein [Streptomyces spongiae]
MTNLTTNSTDNSTTGSTPVSTTPVRRMLGGRTMRLLVAMVIGALTGLAVFAVTQITGRNLFIITGAVAGAVAVTVFQLYGRAARLSEVKVTVPQLSEFTFVVNNDARQVAWHLFVETATRVSTQPLAPDEGLIREAMNSLYSLFGTTRDILKESRPSVAATGAQTVESMALAMLNQELRPFLSGWHPRLREFETAHPDDPESAWPDNAACRAELRTVQRHIHAYALGFARLAGVHDADTLISSRNS